MSIEEFSNELASSNPTPGGGSAAAVALSQGASLTVMVSDITIGREKWKSGWQAGESAKEVATPLIKLGLELADYDSQSFIEVMNAFKLPKENEEDISARRNAIREATLGAAQVPLETAKHANSLLSTLTALAQLGNANAVTDVAVASLLASAASKGALLNVEINLASLPEETSNPLMEEVKKLRIDAREMSRSVMKAVYDRM